MIKNLMATTALTGMMLGAAVAQSTPPAPADSPAPAAQTTPMSTAPASAGEAKFISAQSNDQWLSSNFIGVDVVGPDNEKIGDISDLLFDKDGNVIGYVIGVGGFLGIGAKNVALAPSSFEVVPASADRATTGTAGSAPRADDIKLKLNMTKDQLKEASAFETLREKESKARAASQPAPGAPRR